MTGVIVEVRRDGEPVATKVLHGTGPFVIGRALSCDVVVDDLTLSRRHLQLCVDRDTCFVTDLGSTRGTSVDGAPVTRPTPVTAASVMQLGALTVVVRAVDAPAQADGVALVASGLVVALPDGTRLLDEASLAVPAGSLVAVLGPTGSGKSTLVKTLMGMIEPAAGAVVCTQGGRTVPRPAFGYVPQDDVVHAQLTIRQALEFGAELRFPADTDPAARRAVDAVMRELGLTARRRADPRLSGGQRKRTSVALELLTRPPVLVLDEPTSGLDPGYEQNVMELLRELSDGGRTVLVVTHSLASLDLCDQVVVLAPGGRIVYSGPPAGAPAHFGVADYTAMFHRLETVGPFLPVPSAPMPVAVPVADAPAPSPLARDRWIGQVRTLVARQLAVLLADRRNLAVLAASAAVPALLMVLLLEPGAFDLASAGHRAGARTLLGALMVTATALGAANGLREIVKETPIYLRERSVGVSRSAYLAAKIASLGAVTALQCVVLTVVGTARAGGAGLVSFGGIQLIIAVILAGVAALAVGLLVSAFVSSSEKALALVPVVFVVSWLFSGAAIDLQAKPVMRAVAYASTANWGVAAGASAVDLPSLEDGTCAPADPGAPTAAATEDRCDARFGPGLGVWVFDVFVLVVLSAAFGLLAEWALARREPLERDRRASLLGRGWADLGRRFGWT